MTKKPAQKTGVLNSHWKTVLVAAISSFSLAYSSYLVFLQPEHVISRLRLALTGAIWLALFIILLLLLNADVLKFKRLQPKMIRLAFVISSIFSAFVLAVGMGLDAMPYNLLLLPRHSLIIQPQCPAGSGIVELNYFKDGLDVVSYAAFEKTGNWERTKDSLRTLDCEQARLSYRGWLVEKPELAFRTQPGGGSVTVAWNGIPVRQDLSASAVHQIILSHDFGPDRTNKLSSLLTFILALASLLFPLAGLFSAEIIDPSRHQTLKNWFEETATNLRPLVLSLFILSFLATAGLCISPWLEQDHTPAKPANPAVQEKPNIILIIADSMSAQDMSLFGYSLPTTPNLEKETKDWSIFTNANTAATCTIGIFPALDTGRYPIYSYPFSQYGEKMAADPDWVNLMALISQAGYTTYWNNYYIYIPPNIYHAAQGIDNFLFFTINNPLFRTWYQSNSLRYNNFPYYPFLLQLAAPFFHQNSSFYDSPMVLGEMFSRNEFKAPFFIYMHYRGPHCDPYYSGKYEGTFLPVSEGMTTRDEQNDFHHYPLEKQPLVNKLHLRYDEAILHEDDSLGALIEKIKQSGLYDSSMIIIIGDHGQVFDNGFVAHCTPLISRAETHIPLLVKFPYQSQGERNSSLVSILDITPTILDVANIHYEKSWFDGLSLLSNQEQFNTRKFLFVRNLIAKNDVNRTPSFAVMNNRFKLTLRIDGYYLYDYLNDPNEKNNLFNDASFDQTLLKEMKTALDEFVHESD